MAKIFRRHFRVTQGALLDEIDKISTQRSAAKAAARELLQRVGAADFLVWEDGSFAGFSFSTPPDADLYHRKGKAWLPVRGTDFGKQTWKQIKALPPCPSYQMALSAVGLHPELPALIDEDQGVSHRSLVGGFPDLGIWFVDVPWRDVDQEELSVYQAKRAAGQAFSTVNQHLLWTPPTDWEEIKEWQYLKEWEELQTEAA